MPTEDKQVIVNFKIEQQLKRRFNADMQLRGTTASEQLRQAVMRYLEALDAGDKDPQITLDLTAKRQA